MTKRHSPTAPKLPRHVPEKLRPTIARLLHAFPGSTVELTYRTPKPTNDRNAWRKHATLAYYEEQGENDETD